MELRFDAMLCSWMRNENSDMGHIKCPRGPQVPPCFTTWKSRLSSICQQTFFNAFALVKLSRIKALWKGRCHLKAKMFSSKNILENLSCIRALTNVNSDLQKYLYSPRVSPLRLTAVNMRRKTLGNCSIFLLNLSRAVVLASSLSLTNPAHFL